MSLWLAVGVALGVGVLACAAACLRDTAMAGVAAIQVAGSAAAIAFLVLAAGFDREAFADLGLVLAVLSFAGTLAFLRYLERAR